MTPPHVCVIIPAYQEEKRIGRVVTAVRQRCESVVVIDDGSSDGTRVAAEAAGAVALVHAVNKGKGVALNTGFAYAREHKFECVITMDADGQHAPDDIPAFLEEYGKGEYSVLIGNRMNHMESMPLVRRLVNRFMSWLLSRKMGQWVPDTQSGFRLYGADVLPFLNLESQRFAAESEVLLALAEKGVRIGSVPIQIIYGDETSKIRPMADTWRFFNMLRTHKKARRP